MFLQVDGTFLIQLLNFAIFFALLNVLFLRPVSKAIRERRAYINGVTRDYDTYRAEAAALRAEAEGIRTGARRDADAAAAKTRGDASNVAAQLASDYGARVQAEIERAHAEANRELEAARAGEERIVRELADMMLDRTIPGGAR